jgi:hypothetical protein
LDRIAIIGAGFTSFILYERLKKYNPYVISPNKFFLKDNYFLRNKDFEINKLFADKAFSFNNQIFELDNIRLHDRLIFGGNSNIWGGFCDISHFNKKILEFFKKRKIYLNNIDFNSNGCASNVSSIKQFNDVNGNIWRVRKNITNFIDGFVTHFQENGRIIKLKILQRDLNNKLFLVTKNFNKVFIAVSIPQLISLLKNSNIIKNDDIISFSEFKYDYSLRFLFNYNEKKIVRIYYNFFGIIKHFFSLKLKFFFNFIPIYLVQNFYHKRNIAKIKNIKDNIFKEIYSQKKFGNSIHISDVKINNLKLSKILNKNVQIFGPAGFKQSKPGPITNDIVSDIMSRIKI